LSGHGNQAINLGALLDQLFYQMLSAFIGGDHDLILRHG
jgi:hypothetical protein